MATIKIEYKCRRCGKQFGGFNIAVESDTAAITIARMRVFRVMIDDDADEETGLSNRSHGRVTHDCGGGGFGLADFVGVMVLGEGRKIEADTVPG